MNRYDVCKVLGDVREQWLTEAEVLRAPASPAAAKTRLRRQKKRLAVLLAACLALLVSGAAFAVSEGGTALLAFFSDRGEPGSDLLESGYDLRISIERLPLDALSANVRRLGDVIAQQHREQPIYSSASPSLWARRFASRDEACDFVGLAALRAPEFDLLRGETELRVLGNAAGEIESLHLETAARDGDIRLQFFTEIYTEHHAEDSTMLTRYAEHVEFRESFYQSKAGKNFHIIEVSAMESGYAGLDAYLTENGVLYQLHLAYQAEDAQRAQSLLHSWAESF